MLWPWARPRTRADTLGWSSPRIFAAFTWVRLRSARRSRMRCTSLALARANSGFGRSRSANTLPLPCSIRIGGLGLAFVLLLLFFDPFCIVLRSLLQSGFHLRDFFQWSL